MSQDKSATAKHEAVPDNATSALNEMGQLDKLIRNREGLKAAEGTASATIENLFPSTPYILKPEHFLYYNMNTFNRTGITALLDFSPRLPIPGIPFDTESIVLGLHFSKGLPNGTYDLAEKVVTSAVSLYHSVFDSIDPTRYTLISGKVIVQQQPDQAGATIKIQGVSINLYDRELKVSDGLIKIDTPAEDI